MTFQYIYVTVTALVISTALLFCWRSNGRHRKQKPPSPEHLRLVYPHDEGHDQREGWKFDIITVHGLGAHPVYTWTKKITEKRSDGDAAEPPLNRHVNWVAEFLPVEFPDHRIYSFEHNAAWLFAAPLKSSRETARALLNELRRRRTTPEERKPIIIIAHSFGGNIIKDAIVLSRLHDEFADFREAVCGIIFLGTPHKGSRQAWYGTLLTTLLSFVVGSSDTLIKSLTYHERDLYEKHMEFLGALVKGTRLHCFYEQLPTFLLPQLISIGLIVERHSAEIESAENESMNTDHSGMNKFENNQHKEYRKISSAIRIVEKAVSDCHKYLQVAEEDLKSCHDSDRDATPKRRGQWLIDSDEYAAWETADSDQFLHYRTDPNIAPCTDMAEIAQHISNTRSNAITMHVFCGSTRWAENGRRGASANHILLSLFRQLLVHSFAADKTWAESLDNQTLGLIEELPNPLFDPGGEVLVVALDKLFSLHRDTALFLIMDRIDQVQTFQDAETLAEKIRELWGSRGRRLKPLKVLVSSSSANNAIKRSFINLPTADPGEEIHACLRSLRPYAQNIRQLPEGGIVRMEQPIGRRIKPVFNEWLQHDQSDVLLLLGIAGSGKSTILAHLADSQRQEYSLPDLEKTLDDFDTGMPPSLSAVPGVIVASFFYSQNEPTTDSRHLHMLASVLFQVLLQNGAAFSIFQHHFRQLRSASRRNTLNMNGNEATGKEADSWSLDALKHIFRNLPSLTETEIFLFIDALDEAESKPPTQRPGLVREAAAQRGLLEMFTWDAIKPANSARIKTVMTSRHFTLSDGDLARCRREALEKLNRPDIDDMAESKLVTIRQRIHDMNLTESQRADYDFDLFKTRLLENCGGVFLWVAVVLEEIENLTHCCQISPTEMMRVLDMPTNLDQLYSEMFDRLKKRQHEDPKTRLWIQWVITAVRPLDTAEFVDAITISKPDCSSLRHLERDRLPSDPAKVHTALTSRCGGLLLVRTLNMRTTADASIKVAMSPADSTNSFVQLLHWTAKHFFQDSQKAGWLCASLPDSHVDVARGCIRYLKFAFIRTHRSDINKWTMHDFERFTKYLEDLPLLHYALSSLPSHLNATAHLDAAKELFGLLSQLFSDVRDIDELGRVYEGYFVLSSWIHVTTSLDSRRRSWLEKSTHFWEKENSAARAARRINWEQECSRFLVTALVIAVRKKLFRAVKVLCEAGAKPYTKDTHTLETGLETAVKVGSPDTLDYLIQRASEESTNSTPGESIHRIMPQESLVATKQAVELAAKRGDVSMIRRFAPALAGELVPAMHAAVSEDDIAIVGAFLDAGVDVNRVGENGSTALQIAAREGYKDTVHLLLRHGAEPNVQDDRRHTAMSLANENRHEEIKQLLIAYGATRRQTSKGSKEPINFLYSLPYPRNQRFVGRKQELDWLYDCLSPGSWESSSPKMAALVGLGGIGKTQIALEYAYRAQFHYRYIFWIRADSRSGLLSSSHDIASQLGIIDSKIYDEPMTSLLLKKWLETGPGGWLLIFDNVEDGQVIQPYLPTYQTAQKGCIILTSRNTTLEVSDLVIPITPLDPEAASQMILSGVNNPTPEDMDHALSISHELGQLPLALAHMAGYIHRSGMSLKQFLDVYRKGTSSRTSLLSRSYQGNRYASSVGETWKLAFQALSSHARELLQIISFFDPDGIPLKLLKDESEDPLNFYDSISQLQERSLIQQENGRVVIHRLVSEVVQMELRRQPGEMERSITSALGRINMFVPMRTNGPSSAEFIPHAMALLAKSEDYANASKMRVELLYKTGSLLLARGLNAEVIRLLSQPCRDMEVLSRKSKPHIYMLSPGLLNTLAGALATIPDVRRREHTHAMGLLGAVISRNPGGGMFELHLFLNNLGLLLAQMAKPDDASKNLQEAFKKSTGRQGPNALDAGATDTLLIQANTAMLWADANRLIKAKAKIAELLQLFRRHRHAHPEIFFSLQANLGVIAYRQGHLEEAKGLFEQAMDLGARDVTGFHRLPHAALVLENMAVVYLAADKASEAVKFLDEALRIRQAHANHDDFVTSTKWDLSRALKAMDRDQEALAMQAEALGYWREHNLVADSLQPEGVKWPQGCFGRYWLLGHGNFMVFAEAKMPLRLP